MTPDITPLIPDAEQIKALAHPERLRMLGILRLHGPQTASSLAARLGLNSGATSYHLRQLARHGFIGEAPELGTKRDRWWRAAHQATRFETDAPSGSAEADATDAFLQVLLSEHFAQAQRALAQAQSLPAEWRHAATASDATLLLTAEEATALSQELVERLIEMRRDTPPLDGPAPAGTRRFTVLIHAFATPDVQKPE